jgi:hypothetical protein
VSWIKAVVWIGPYLGKSRGLIDAYAYCTVGRIYTLKKCKVHWFGAHWFSL